MDHKGCDAINNPGNVNRALYMDDDFLKGHNQYVGRSQKGMVWFSGILKQASLQHLYKFV